MKVKISNWFGRTGNNIIQVINSIYYSFYINNYEKIILPPHNLFLVNTIKNKEESVQESEKTFVNNFFYSKKLGFTLEPYQMREIAQKYICDIIDINLNSETGNNELFIHVRGGDAMNDNVFLLQNPLKLYTLFINKEKYEKINIVYEDKYNPVIDKLNSLNNNTLSFQSSSIKQDLETLCKGSELLMCLSTFSLAVYFLSKNIKHIFIPKFMSELWYPNMEWGLKVTKIDFEDYTIENWKKLTARGKQDLLLRYNKNIILV